MFVPKRLLVCLYFFCLSIASPARALSLGRCTQLETTDTALSHKIDEGTRIELAEGVLADVKALVGEIEKPTTYPRDEVEFCLKKKKAQFRKLVLEATDASKESLKLLRVLGEYSETLRSDEDAFESYKKIAAKDSSDYSALVKSYLLYQKINLTRLAAKDPKLTRESDVTAVLSESERYLKLIEANPKVPPETKARLLSDYAQIMEAYRGHEPAAQQIWERVLKFDRNYVLALAHRATYEYSRNKFIEANPFLERLTQVEPDNIKFQKMYLQSCLSAHDYRRALKVSQALQKRWPKDSEITQGYAEALNKAGFSQEAEEKNREVLKANPKNKEISSSQAQILERKGDKLVAQKQTTPAILSYQEALKLNPQNLDLRKKLAYVIYDYRQSKNFEPAAATRPEMKQVEELLRPLLQKDGAEDMAPADQRALEKIYIGACLRGETYKPGAEVCRRHADASEFADRQSLFDCLTLYRKAGAKNDAKSLVESAMGSEKFQSARRELGSLLLNLK